MKVLVVGSREFSDYSKLENSLDSLYEPGKIELIISGGAKGADSLAEVYADVHRIEKSILLPDWDLHGKKAGILRNVKMVDMTDEVVAFWDGESRGTKSTIDYARKKDKPVTVVLYEND